MPYFESFPYVDYQFPNDTQKVFKNISLRPDLIQKIKQGHSLEVHNVQDNETPETLAYDYYGEVDLHWIIMLANDVFNIYTDWPMSQKILNDYMLDKYRVQKDSDGIERTLTDLQVYEFIEFVGLPENNYTSYIELYSDSDNTPKVMIRPRHFVDSNNLEYGFGSFSNNVDAFGRVIVKPELTPVSYYDWEQEQNEEKKKIIIPPAGLAQQIKRELEDIFR